MSAPGPTMKSIQKRFYTVLPRVVSSTTASSSSSPSSSSPITRVRSNSASSSRSLYTNSSVLPLSFFDSPPPPPSSRPGNPHVLSTNRLPIEAKGEVEGQPNVSGQQAHPQGPGQPPFSLALTSAQPNSSLSLTPSTGQYSFFPYSPFNPIPYYTASTPSTPDARPTPKRQRLRYQLDVGAYGIPKQCRTNIISGRDGRGNTNTMGSPRGFHTRATEDLNLAVQVGEDAYFIRDNAMGVADGVGGWARVKQPDFLPSRTSSPHNSSPSALFARRLMHFCSAEVDSASNIPPTSCSLPLHPSLSTRPSTSLPHSPFHPRPHRSPPHPTSIVDAWPWSEPNPYSLSSDLQEDLEDSLEELEEGLDVLMILERAYERTLKAHVVPAPSQHPPSDTPSHSQNSAQPPLPIPSVSFSSSSKHHSTIAPSTNINPNTNTIPLMAGSSTALLAVLDHVPRPPTDPKSGSASKATSKPEVTYDAVIKIAHIGDCMGMLVRGEEIAWRSEEMWWGFNAPVQLGPTTPCSPQSSAHLFTLPVQADDILILASDGLSDNLWDEDVLDEVVRFRKGFLGEGATDSKVPKTLSSVGPSSSTVEGAFERILRRRTLAGMLSEALCSRARRVSERRVDKQKENVDDEVPFARRAREQGKSFRGGKNDDISVIVAVISPAADLAQHQRSP